MLPDLDARERIAKDLDTNLLVEAGAGSGKTKSLVDRMVALIATGTAEVGQIAAVTFTRKAAGELRERFQEALEKARKSPSLERGATDRLEKALHQIDRAFTGTIHAFCARLLREQPLEAGIDPAFREMTAHQADQLANRFWTLHVERLAARGDALLDDLTRVGLGPEELQAAYHKLRDHTDVSFPADAVPFPSSAYIAAARGAVDELLAEANRLLPAHEPEKGWDDLQKPLRKLMYLRSAGRWRDDRFFLNTVADFCGVREYKITQNRWSDAKAGKDTAKRFVEQVNRFLREGPAATAVRTWQAHRYPIAMRFAREAAQALTEHRRVTGQLDFQDLLLLTVSLLRRSPEARRYLGERFRRLLVDEFQDTDPLQAEILFLLASEPSPIETGAERPDWRTAVPRPGALFVVGDPKQSIYRFRRADIQLYGQVRDRFHDFGDVVRLESNFRSSKPIADIVNAVFASPGLFPPEPTAEQAPFASLVAQHETQGAHDGVYFYEVKPPSNSRPDVAEWDASALADWIARRVTAGERKAGAFLILLHTRRHIELYARALEMRNLPVQVSGAGVGIDDELGEVRVLLQALADPGDPVKTVAALVGLFFGLDHQQLLDHRMNGGGFDFRFAKAGDSEGAVERALATLRRWWTWTRDQPADASVSRIADEVGLLPHAASGDLGAVRAGALAFALDAIRGAGLSGDTSLAAALDAMEAVLDEEETEAPLEPGREDVVRLMNLHKAKGLEAEVVILARPFTNDPPDPVSFVERQPEGTVGWLLVRDERGRPARVLARPLDWEDKDAAERSFERAEEVRELYVAATRAKQELVVAFPQKADTRSPWSPLYGWPRANGRRLDLVAAPAPAREQLGSTAEELMLGEDSARQRRDGASRETWRFVTVTRLAKADPAGAPTSGPSDAPEGMPAEAPRRADAEPPLPPLELESERAPGGYTWGSAVHGVLEAAARGANRDQLRALARSLLLELDRPAPGGEPTELEALVTTAERVTTSELWRRALSAKHRLAEVPFALARAGSDPPTYLEGVIDLAFAEEDGWVVVDYKTDRGDDPDFPERRSAYRAQLRLYGSAWEDITGERVKERLLWFVRSGVIESV